MSDIRDCTDADRAAVVATLSRAFTGDPAMSYIFPNPADRAKRLPRLFAMLYDEDASGMRLVTGDARAATLWQGPARHDFGRLDMLRQLIPLVGTFGFAIGRALNVVEALEAHYPHAPFWYLHIAGVDPAHQRQGLGGASIRAGLARVAGDGSPTYLETATERNIGLYQSLGFNVTSEWHVPKGGPTFWSMLRPAD